MDILNTKIKDILTEKNTKIRPENIIKGVTILGVPGNGEFTVKVDPSIETGRTGMENYITEIRNLDLTSIPTTSLSSFWSMYYNLKKVSFKNTNRITDMSFLFHNCNELEEIDFSKVNTSKVKNMQQMFYNCISLKDVPIFNTSSVTNFSNMFGICPLLSDESVNNILQMCINATSYAGTKTLKYLGFNSSWCPASRIQALSNYQAFLNARWTIGY